MAKREAELIGSFDVILKEIEDAVFKSMSASLEESSDFISENSRCAVRVYERYSWLGGNRVSLNLTLVQTDERIFISVITSGGSQAIFVKINTWGEKSFLSTIDSTINKFRKYS